MEGKSFNVMSMFKNVPVNNTWIYLFLIANHKCIETQLKRFCVSNFSEIQVVHIFTDLSKSINTGFYLENLIIYLMVL